MSYISGEDRGQAALAVVAMALGFPCREVSWCAVVTFLH
jgi:hypothetical protein